MFLFLTPVDDLMTILRSSLWLLTRFGPGNCGQVLGGEGRPTPSTTGALFNSWAPPADVYMKISINCDRV